MALLFSRVIFVDWSAASTRGPARPSADRCWLAYGDSRGRKARAEPEYFRTRHECCSRIVSLAAEAPGRVLIGFDFPLGYPEALRAVLPTGRKLCALLGSLVRDEESGANNRFEVAAELNRRIERGLGVSRGPFWGCPMGATVPGLSATRPESAVPQFRLVEEHYRGLGHRIQSPFKLYTTGSVGSQALLGMAAVDRMLAKAELRDRALLWPFETAWADRLPRGAVVMAEIWPSLCDHARQKHAVKDARQVAAVRDWAMDEPGEFERAMERPEGLTAKEAEVARRVEGWILGPAAG